MKLLRTAVYFTTLIAGVVASMHAADYISSIGKGSEEEPEVKETESSEEKPSEE